MRAVKTSKIKPETTSIPDSKRPVTIGFGSVPGGTGCTTLACQFTVHAAMQHRTLAMSVDRSGDMVRRLVGDKVLQIDGHWRHSEIPGLRVSYCPPDVLAETYEEEDRRPDVRMELLDYLPNLSLPRIPDLIVVDLGPGQIPNFDLDFWVVPVRDQRSVQSLCDGTYPVGLKGTLFVSNAVDTWRKTRLPSDELLGALKAHCAAKACEMVRFLSTPVPYSGLLQRTAAESKHIWELGDDNSCTRKRVERVCIELLSIARAELRFQDLRSEMESAEESPETP